MLLVSGLGSADEYDETMETERRLNDLHFRIKDCNSGEFLFEFKVVIANEPVYRQKRPVFTVKSASLMFHELFRL